MPRYTHDRLGLNASLRVLEGIVVRGVTGDTNPIDNIILYRNCIVPCSFRPITFAELSTNHGIQTLARLLAEFKTIQHDKRICTSNNQRIN
jgi:hypothetical protein